MEKIKIALIQMKTGLNKDENICKAEDLISVAASHGADIAVLPEMFSIPFMTVVMKTAMETIEEGIISSLRQAAASNNINVLGGSFPERASNDHCYNSSVFIDRRGNIGAIHRKLHMFDADLGSVAVKESDVVLPGNTVTVFETEFGKAGIAICFDLRFPELIRAMADQGAKIVFVPAAFNTVTGPAHWELLIRSRALDNNIFVAGCSPASDPSLPYDPYGFSMIADPWGDVLIQASRTEDIVYAEIDFSRLDEVKKKLPLDEHRRPEIYRRG